MLRQARLLLSTNKNEKTGHKLKSRYHFELNPVWKIQLFHLQLQANEFIFLFLALKHTNAAHSEASAGNKSVKISIETPKFRP